MRPLRIELSAFGPYPGIELVDFSRLATRGLYVITGPTGSGKTTVFDAMTFALYNTMALKEPKEIRSHHAEPTVPTWVRFAFELDGREYRVERSPEYERPKQRGGGTTKESPTASLVRVEPDGSSVSLATKVNEVTERCTELIGLSADQFERVMLLPQGLVTQFLLDKSPERERLLARLFGGEIYDRAVERLKVIAGERQQALGASEETLRHHLANAVSGVRRVVQVLGLDAPDDLDEADADAVADLLTTTDQAYTALERNAATTTEAARLAENALEQAREQTRRFDRAVGLRAELAQLSEAEPSVLANERSATASQHARPVVVAAETAERAEAAAERAYRERDERCASITRLADRVGIEIDVRSTATVITDLAAADREARAALTLLDERDHRARSVAQLSATLDTRQGQLGRQRSSLAARSDELVELQAERDQLISQRPDLQLLEEEADRLERARADRELLTLDRARWRDAESALAERRAEQAETWRRFVATQAPRLAGELLEGAPCPVCGSTDHPEPAADHDGEAVTYEAVSAAAAAVDAADEHLQRLGQSVNEHLVRLGDLAELTDPELTERIELQHQATAAALKIHARGAELTTLIGDLEQQVVALQRAIAALGATITADETTLATEQALLDTASARCIDIERSRVEAVAEALDRCRELATDIEVVFEQADRAHITAANARERAEEVLATSRFTTLVEARAAVLDETLEERRLGAALAHRDSLNRAGSALQTLLEQGVPDVRPSVDELDSVAARARQLASETAAAWEKASIGRSDCLAALARHRQEAASTETLRRAALTARRTYQVCAGQGTIRMSLRRWVLANELDRVTAAASVHLLRMTNGRYRIRRLLEARDAKSAFGLDLEILDAHTGRPRRPSSLSGGEQFQASLALALGLADVISHGGTATGRRMEALFIDEGFGSLDPDALDDAIETLHQLRASGRTVGAITHVEAMKERLHVGIAVERLESGRGSRLLVTP